MPNTMIALLFMLAISGTSCSETVDLIEINHYYDCRGKLVFDQIIFYERSPATGRFNVRVWCMADDDRRPVKSEATGRWSVAWLDENAVRRTVSSSQYRESWSQVDPERDNKKYHDEHLRVHLATRIAEVGE